jgi:hypothetical protein
MFTRITLCVVLALTSSPKLFGVNFAVKANDKGYLDTEGFIVFLYDSTYFASQKPSRLIN